MSQEKEIASQIAPSLSPFQFILPITLISFAHHAIKKKLRKLPSWQRKQSGAPTAATSLAAASTALASTNGTPALSASGRDQTISVQGRASEDHLSVKIDQKKHNINVTVSLGRDSKARRWSITHARVNSAGLC